MTETRDFDTIARAWLDLMPDEAPDRVIDSVLQATAQLPQVRAPLRRHAWNTRLRWVTGFAAAALLIVVGAAIALILRPAP